MKKFKSYLSLSFLTAILLVMVSMPIIAGADTDGDYTYQINGSEAVLLHYEGSGGDVTIPSTLGGYSVTSIGDYAFAGCSGLTSVTIPDSVTNIGNTAFAGCTGLTSVVIPGSVTSIGNQAFISCTGLTSVVIPGSVASIGNQAFYSCTNMTSLTISEGVTTIGNSAFSNCIELTSVVIPDSVTSIGAQAFAGCTKLSSAVVPESASVDGSAFVGTNLPELVYDYTVTDNKVTINRYNSSVGGDLVIPSTLGGYPVTSIGESAFNTRSGITSVTIPDGVTSIGRGAFSGCSSLASITIPDGVTYIGTSAFSSTAYYNNEENWEDDALYIGQYLIAAKTSITGEYSIKQGTVCIAAEAFNLCSSMTEVNIPDSVEYICDNAFRFCYVLNNVTIPGSVISIGKGAFTDCNGLKNVTISDGVKIIGDDVFQECFQLEHVKLSNTLTTIGSGVFSGCIALEGIIEIPESVTSMDSSAFPYNNHYLHLIALCSPDADKNPNETGFVTYVSESLHKTVSASSRRHLQNSRGDDFYGGDFLEAELTGYEVPDGMTIYYCWAGDDGSTGAMDVTDTTKRETALSGYLCSKPYGMVGSMASEAYVYAFALPSSEYQDEVIPLSDVPSAVLVAKSRKYTVTTEYDNQKTDLRQVASDAMKAKLDNLKAYMAVGEELTLTQLLGRAGIGHVYKCCQIEFAINPDEKGVISVAETSVNSIKDYTITGNAAGIENVIYVIRSFDCVYHGTMQVEYQPLEIHVISSSSTTTSITLDNVIAGTEVTCIETGAVLTADSSRTTTFTGLTPDKQYSFEFFSREEDDVLNSHSVVYEKTKPARDLYFIGNNSGHYDNENDSRYGEKDNGAIGIVTTIRKPDTSDTLTVSSVTWDVKSTATAFERNEETERKDQTRSFTKYFGNEAKSEGQFPAITLDENNASAVVILVIDEIYDPAYFDENNDPRDFVTVTVN